MHDGIHKNAPVPKEWKSLVKACSQKVWKELAPQKTEKMIIDRLKKLKPIVEQAQVWFSNPQAYLDSSMEIEKLRGSCCNTLQSEFVDALKRHLAHNEAQPIHQACVSTIQKNLDAHLRNIDGYLASQFPQDRLEMNHRLNQTLKFIHVEEQIRELMAGTKLQPTRLPQLTLDEAIV